ncbi:amidohydrolase [Acidipila sp. EB88]|uniref:amidohydrolase family protein n=1 Tax=Acidipila sp. EB88 TaxID=2305226 RepID=UPI001F321174|nr:amidohydrolase family protein [Acidipila sp. EB88]
MPKQAASGRIPHIDAHHHLWCYRQEEFAWIDDASSALRRDFAVCDLLHAMDLASIDTAIAVQARESLEETRWLLQTASEHPRICAVVGWVPLADRDLPHLLDSFHNCQTLAGFRVIAQDQAAGYFDQSALNNGMRVLTAFNYSFDLLVRAHQLTEAIRLVDRHPRQSFVLDHAAKPPIHAGRLEPWKSQLLALAERPNVVCKLSGLATEAGCRQPFTSSSLRPYLDVCVQAFGCERLLAGSDWPVCLLATTYEHWWSMLREYFVSFSPGEQAAMFGGNAARAYSRSTALCSLAGRA